MGSLAKQLCDAFSGVYRRVLQLRDFACRFPFARDPAVAAVRFSGPSLLVLRFLPPPPLCINPAVNGERETCKGGTKKGATEGREAKVLRIYKKPGEASVGRGRDGGGGMGKRHRRLSSTRGVAPTARGGRGSGGGRGIGRRARLRSFAVCTPSALAHVRTVPTEADETGGAEGGG